MWMISMDDFKSIASPSHGEIRIRTGARLGWNQMSKEYDGSVCRVQRGVPVAILLYHSNSEIPPGVAPSSG